MVRLRIPGLVMGAVTAIGLSHATTAWAATPEDPSGTWLTEDGRGRIRIEKCGALGQEVCGYVVWMKEPKDGSGRLHVDAHNPDGRSRSRVLLGHQLLMGLTPTDDARFAGGIYNADNGKTYEVTMWRESPRELRLKGCMLAFFCGSQTWKLAHDVLPGELTGATGEAAGPRSDPPWMQARARFHTDRR